MSVTELIKQNDVREILDRIIPPYQRSQRSVVIQVPSRAGSQRLLGTAFDYALRFEIHRRSPQALVTGWVAEASLVHLERALALAQAVREAGETSMITGPAAGVRHEEVRRLVLGAKRCIREARIFVREHLGVRQPDRAWMEQLAEHAIGLARLDAVHRAGYLGPELLSPGKPAEIAEIVALLHSVPFDLLLDGSDVLLNPTFGRWSALVGGADADLIIGGRLIDLKLLASAAVERDMVRQLVAYLILAECARRDGEPLPQISSLEIYLARHARLWTLPAGPILRHPEYAIVERRFLEVAEKVYRRSPPPTPEPSPISAL